MFSSRNIRKLGRRYIQVRIVSTVHRRTRKLTLFFRTRFSNRRRPRIRSPPFSDFLVGPRRTRIRRERVRSSFRSAAIICIVRFSTSVLTHQMASDTIETLYRRNGLVEIYDLHQTESYFSAAFSNGKNENRRRSTSIFDAKTTSDVAEKNMVF